MAEGAPRSGRPYPKNGNGYRFPQAFRRTLHESWSANGLRLAAQQALRLRR